MDLVTVNCLIDGFVETKQSQFWLLLILLELRSGDNDGSGGILGSALTPIEISCSHISCTSASFTGEGVEIWLFWVGIFRFEFLETGFTWRILPVFDGRTINGPIF